MKISDMNWSQVEAYLKTDDRAVIPLGSTKQHAHLSLSVVSILSERVALTAAEERPPTMEPPHMVVTGEEMGERVPPVTGTRLGQEPVLAMVPSAPPSAMPFM